MLAYISNLDTSLIHMVQSIGPSWRIVALFLSNALSYGVLFVIFIIALCLMRKYRVALELAIITFGSLAVAYVFKVAFHAPRPYAIDPSVIAYDTDTSWGLPSAHALMSVVILGWVAIRHPKSHLLMWGSLAIIILIGISRVYLGVHYPSQVLAGWVLGILVLYVVRVIDKRLWAPFQKKLK